MAERTHHQPVLSPADVAAHVASSHVRSIVVTHESGLVFTVIDGNSYDARIARDRRPLTMTDGSTWTVGTRGHASTIAWKPPQPTQPSAEHVAAAERGFRTQLLRDFTAALGIGALVAVAHARYDAEQYDHANPDAAPLLPMLDRLARAAA